MDIGDLIMKMLDGFQAYEMMPAARLSRLCLESYRKSALELIGVYCSPFPQGLTDELKRDLNSIERNVHQLFHKAIHDVECEEFGNDEAGIRAFWLACWPEMQKLMTEITSICESAKDSPTRTSDIELSLKAMTIE